MRTHKLYKLLSEEPESYYWLGFLMADAHFGNKGRLRVRISDTDEKHIEKLSKFLEVPYRILMDKRDYVYASIDVCSKEVVGAIMDKFEIKSNKSIIPCNINTVDGDRLFALSIGFIDGDGSIGYQSKRKDASLRIKCHKAWKDNLEYMYGSAKINNQGYAFTNITNNTKLREMKQKCLSLKLPYMERKWNKIDLNKESRQKNTSVKVDIIEKELLKGTKKKQIAEILGISQSALSNMIKRKNIGGTITK